MSFQRSICVILPLTYGMHATMAPQAAWATSYRCGPIPRRILEADAIVVGHTTSTQGQETQPGIVTIVYGFEIDEFLKGDEQQSRELLSRQSTRRRPVVVGPLLPRSSGGTRVVLMRKDADGTLRIQPCGIARDKADLPEIRRMAAVSLSPADYLGSDEDTDVWMILAWIEYHYFRRRDPTPKKNEVAAELPIDRMKAMSYVTEHAGDEAGSRQSEAVAILARFATPEHRALLEGIVQNTENRRARVAAQSILRHLDAQRDVPGLIGNLRSLRQARKGLHGLLSDGSRRQAVEPDQKYNNAIAELIRVLGFARNPAAGADFIRELEHTAVSPTSVGTGLGDETALAPILRLACVQPGKAETLAGVFDPEIVRNARLHLHDDRESVVLLATKGDREVADFMVRLIRQGHRDGARWAATVQDRSLVEHLIEAMSRADAYRAGCMAYALGRMRVFDVMDRLDDADSLRQKWKQQRFLLGLLNESLDRKVRLDWDNTKERLDGLATREQWPIDAHAQVSGLARTTAARANAGLQVPYNSTDRGVAWIPPAGLPSMPDAWATQAVKKYLRENPASVSAVLLSGAEEDRCKVLVAASRSQVKLERNAVANVLLNGSLFVRMYARRYLEEQDVGLTEEQVRRWALGGSYEMTKDALQYIIARASRSHAPIVAEVFHRGWHLFDDKLFRAIIATRAEVCVEELRSYVVGHHIDLRRWAAVTLGHFGDDAGLSLLEPIHLGLGRADQPSGAEVQLALHVLRTGDSAWPSEWLSSGSIGPAVGGGIVVAVALVVWYARKRSQRSA